MLKRIQMLFIALFSVVLLAACGGNQSPRSYNQASTETVAVDQAQKTTDVTSDGIGQILGEKVIKTASLNYETTQFDEAVEVVRNHIKAQGGALEYSSQSQNKASYGYTGSYLTMTVRLPIDKLQSFVDALNGEKILTIQNQELGSQDVSQTYRDNETRIAVLKEEEATLRKMMEEQGNLENLIVIQERLSQVIMDRELLEQSNQQVDNQVSYSTAYVTIQQTDRVNNRDVTGFWPRLQDAVADSFYSAVAFLQGTVIFLVYVIPYALVMLILALLVRFLSNAFQKSGWADKIAERQAKQREKARQNRQNNMNQANRRPSAKPEQGKYQPSKQKPISETKEETIKEDLTDETK